MIAVEDIGVAVSEILDKPELIGKDIYISGDQLTGEEICNLMSEVLQIEMHYNEVDDDTFRNLGFPGA